MLKCVQDYESRLISCLIWGIGWGKVELKIMFCFNLLNFALHKYLGVWSQKFIAKVYFVRKLQGSSERQTCGPPARWLFTEKLDKKRKKICQKWQSHDQVLWEVSHAETDKGVTAPLVLDHAPS